MDFKPLELADKPVFDAMLGQRYYENSWFTFTTFFTWREHFATAWALSEDSLYLRLQANGLVYFLAPFAAVGRSFAAAVDAAVRESRLRNEPFLMKGLSSAMWDELDAAFPGRFAMTAQRDYFDYVYRAEDLRTLAGRKYHSKRNFVNRFLAEHTDWSYEPLTAAAKADCLAVEQLWCQQRDCTGDSMVGAEYRALTESLDHFDALQLRGGLIRLAGRPVAFSIGEQLNSDTAVVHMEKADASIPGLYALINRECCRQAWGDVEYVNREEDMGEEGLRKAKESYYPVRLVKKIKINLREG